MDNEKADRMIALLEEIKKLQQQYNENYQTALRNQTEAIALQKKALRMRPTFLLILILIMVVVSLYCLK